MLVRSNVCWSQYSMCDDTICPDGLGRSPGSLRQESVCIPHETQGVDDAEQQGARHDRRDD